MPEINCPNLEQIKDYCEEALERSDQYGVEDGLSFLIGQKFYEVFRQFRQEQNRTCFLYDDYDGTFSQAIEGKTLRVNYAMTVNDNYRTLLDRVKRLEMTCDKFVREILDSFDINDIKEYLTGYPRLGVNPEVYAQIEGKELAPISANEVLSEAQDILYIEDMIQLFS